MTRTRIALAVVLAVTALIAWNVAPALTIAAGVVATVIAALVLWYRLTRTSNTVSRWSERSRKRDGVATTLQVARVSSAWAMRRRATTVRPSLTELGRRERSRTPVAEFAVPLARVGLLQAHSSIEDVTLVFGGPRTGKSGWLAGRVIDAPGALLVTSTRTDLHELTAAMRARVGPVHIFNAVGLGDLPSTITFDPLTGCADPTIAAERAADLMSAGADGDEDGKRWDAQGRRVLTGLLHAAALGGLGMHDVLSWVADPDAAKLRVLSLLRRSNAKAFVPATAQFVGTNDRTRSSITSTIMPALEWLNSPAAEAAANGDHPFDVAELLRSRATVFMLGAEEAHTAALMCALTGHIAREARRIAARQPSGRLDPPLTLALDEAALIAPVPLDSWTADMGGRGVTIIAAFQSRAQVMARYGETAAAVIFNNAASIMVFGGTRDRDDLDYWSKLAGDRDEPVVTTKDGREVSRSVRKVPVLAPAQIANLPAGRVIIYRRGSAVAIGTARMAWDRRDVKAQQKAHARDVAEVLAAAELVVAAEQVARELVAATATATTTTAHPASAGR
jgi:type IV secretory pathway TraG/TraD family ATPase VirD4